jgi:hypothetical protein
MSCYRLDAELQNGLLTALLVFSSAAAAVAVPDSCSILPREEVMSGFVEKFKTFHTNFMEEYGPKGHSNGNTPSDNGDKH